MILMPWIPEPLIYWEGERKVYGVLVLEGVEVTGENYLLFHDSKILSLIERDPDPERLFENLIPNWQRTEESNPKKLFDLLKGSGGTLWQGSRTLVNEYLRKHMKLPELIEHLGLLNLPKEEKPSLHEFRKELMQLTLLEYLEMTT